MGRWLLVNPPDSSQGGFSSIPVGLLYLASALEADGHDVALVDGYLDGFAGIDRALAQFRPEWTGITVYTPGRHKASECARHAKAIGSKVVMGGAHPTLMWSQLIQHSKAVDVCALGEGEQTIRELAAGVSWQDVAGIAYRDTDGRPVQTKQRAYVDNLDDIKWPDWHLAEMDRYPGGGGVFYVRGHSIALGQVRVPLIASRGCLHSCTFCSSWRNWRGHRARSGKDIADEIEMLVNKGYHHFVFQDDAFTQHKGSIVDFCREVVLRDLPIAFFCTTSVDALDVGLATLLKMAGCYGLSAGLESGSQEILDRIGKKMTVEQNEHAVQVAHQVGLAFCALIMVGNRGECDKTINETVAMLRRVQPEDVGTIGRTWIMPGTALYAWAKRQGKIDDSFWLGPEETFTLYDNFTETDLNRWCHAICTRTYI
jgi:anaerobic magnesium-protoporphyrin IX monomethyl ester cyclase